MIRVSSLAIYPVKSCGRVEVDTAEVCATGFRHDRRWMVVGEDGVFLSQRKHPDLARVQVRLQGDRLALEARGTPALEVMFDPAPGPKKVVTVWDDECIAIDEGAEAAGWFSSFLGRSVRLVRLADDDARPLGATSAHPGDRVSFADGFPFLLLSAASVDDLNRRLSLPVPMDRFRPNIVVEGCPSYSEDRWYRLRIGDVDFRVAKACARCVVTTVDQSSGRKGREPLRTLSTYRTVDGQVLFGQNLIHEGRGVIRVEDPVEVLERARDA